MKNTATSDARKQRGWGVVADDAELRPQLAEVLDEVEHKAVVVVDNEDAWPAHESTVTSRKGRECSAQGNTWVNSSA